MNIKPLSYLANTLLAYMHLNLVYTIFIDKNDNVFELSTFPWGLSFPSFLPFLSLSSFLLSFGLAFKSFHAGEMIDMHPFGFFLIVKTWLLYWTLGYSKNFVCVVKYEFYGIVPSLFPFRICLAVHTYVFSIWKFETFFKYAKRRKICWCFYWICFKQATQFVNN